MDSTVFIVLAVACVVVECIFTPLFLKAQRPGISRKSRTFKMICATMFVCIGALCVIYSGNSSEFAKFMMIGLILSWFGDLFLHIKSKMWSFIVGALFFASAHFMYITAYCKAQKQYFPDRKPFTAFEIIAVFVLLLFLYLFYRYKKKMDFKNPGMIASAFYGIPLNAMLIKALVFSGEYLSAGLPDAPAAAILLSLGSIFFFTSDTSLLILIFNAPDKHNHRLKNHNIGTYFSAQTLLAFSILVIG